MKPSRTIQGLSALLASFFIFVLFTIPASKSDEIGLSRQELPGTSPHLTVVAIIISGQIVNGDAKKVAAFLTEIKKTDNGHQIRRLLIHSPGGLVGEAMQIGKLLRANGVEVFIPRELSCISACVLVLAGGATRTIVGKVGLHHPLFLSQANSGDNVPALMAETKQALRDYLHLMGVNEDLADAMFAIPNGGVHYLSQNELLQFKLKISQ